jgi:alcohol dehydrogenase class IV
MSSQETLRQVFPDKATPLISYGLPFTEACFKHVNETFKASRVYLVASASLTKDTTHTFDLQKILALQLIKTRVGMTPHTLISEVLEIVQECREMEIDCFVTLGGGSLIDGATTASFVPSPL